MFYDVFLCMRARKIFPVRRPWHLFLRNVYNCVTPSRQFSNFDDTRMTRVSIRGGVERIEMAADAGIR